MLQSPSPPSPDPAPARFRAGLCAHWAERISETCRARSRLVQPTPLMTRCREHLVESFPETERAIADGDFRRDRQAARLQIDEQGEFARGGLLNLRQQRLR